jgi:tetratricopeptide (TPR) repeat protein
MVRPQFCLVFLFVAAFGIAAYLEPRKIAQDESAGRSASVLALMLGEGRALFANAVFAKADAYFHRGNYPSIFETETRKEECDLAGAQECEEHPGEVHDHEHHDHEHCCGHKHDHDHGHSHNAGASDGSPVPDWIERFGRKFRAADHVHLEKGDEREMLPWLRLSAELDPRHITAYTVSAYWLRKRLDKVDEAERFLRDGLRQNPGHPELLNELAWLFFENRNDPERARNLWRVALRRWHEVEQPKEEPNQFLAQRILAGLVQVETQQNRWSEVIQYLEQLKLVSPVPESVQERIEDARARLTAGAQP